MADELQVNEAVLNGLYVSTIDVADDEILITTQCGRKFRFHHSQECCESVILERWDGDPMTLVGQKLVSVEHESEQHESADGSYTNTSITFRTTEETVVSRWYGESNGYYSEEVGLTELEL